MSKLVLVNTVTGKLYRKRGHFCDATYETVPAAKASLTKMLKKTGDKDTWSVMTFEAYRLAFPVKYEMVRNLMSGEMVRQAVDTPLCCDVSSETYWSL